MKEFIILPIFLLCVMTLADAEIYTWTDDLGTVTFTDNPNQIPTLYNRSIKSGDIISIQTAKPLKALRLRRNTKLHATIPGNRVKSVAAARAEHKKVPLEFQSEAKGYLGGDQKDPATPSMKQPKPLPMGNQPPPTTSGKEQLDTKR